MFSSKINMQSILDDFRVDKMMRYSLFVPRLYNLCRSLGFKAGKIMPSRAFCSDENQGFPIILITKHFGAFPFNHGMVGGIVATDRNGPHAHHGKDMVIIQASHVGYDPQSGSFGSYCRLQTDDDTKSSTCGKISDVISWYREEFQYAQNNIFLCKEGNKYTVRIDNQLLDERRSEGLFLELEKVVFVEGGKLQPLRTLSTSRAYIASDEFRKNLPDNAWKEGQQIKIGENLRPELFYFRRQIGGDVEGQGHLESNLINPMPWIVTAPAPLLVAAQVNTQAEFDRTFRALVKEKEYADKNLFFISCLNIDISPSEGQLFPLTKCVPWAAYIQQSDGSRHTLEQAEIFESLMQQSSENPERIDLEDAIQQMVDAQEIRIAL